MTKAFAILCLFLVLWEVKAEAVLRLAKYLHRAGWQLPLVTKHPQSDLPDLELLSEIILKKTRIQGSHSFEPATIFEPARSLCERLMKCIKRKVKVEPMIVENPEEHWRTRKFNTLICIADNVKEWRPFGFFAVLTNVRRNDFELTYSNCRRSDSSPKILRTKGKSVIRAGTSCHLFPWPPLTAFASSATKWGG